MILKNDLAARFNVSWYDFRGELLSRWKKEGIPDEAIEWFAKNLDYNVTGGKLNRGRSVLDTLQILLGRELEEEEFTKAAALGWGVELLQAFFLVADDIMDSSITRRGQPCWYRVEGVGMTAVNDAFMLQAAIFQLIKEHFRDSPQYVHLLELFLDTTFQTEMGQLIDLMTADEHNVDLSRFSMTKHSKIVTYKTSFYSFYLPVALAMRMANVPECYTTPDGTTMEPYQIALSILLPLGEYFQVQDDFLDYSAPPEILGKIGTDIVDNKCSWCINMAIQKATPEQRKVLDENYGKKPSGGEHEARVKELYGEMGMTKIYEDYEQDVVGKLNKMIDAIPEHNVFKKEIFTGFLNKIYKRQK